MAATVARTAKPKPFDPTLPRHESVVHTLIDAAKRAPDRTALICRDRTAAVEEFRPAADRALRLERGAARR